jgi:hypothetical protein
MRIYHEQKNNAAEYAQEAINNCLYLFQKKADKKIREAYIEQANSALEIIMNDDSFMTFDLFIPDELRNNLFMENLGDVVMEYFNNCDHKIIKALKKGIADMVKISEQIDSILEAEAKEVKMKKTVIFELSIQNIKDKTVALYDIIHPKGVYGSSGEDEYSMSANAKKDITKFLLNAISYGQSIFIIGTYENKNGLNKAYFRKVLP